MTQLVLGLIGKGKWGQNYIKSVANLSDYCILPEEYIKTRNYPDLFEKKDIDGVIIATPTSTHYQIAKQFLEHKFNLLIEKPITKTYRQALELQSIWNKDSIIMAGHIQLYDPTYIELKKNLKKVGKIKKIIYRGLQSPVRDDATVLEDWGPHPIYIFLDILGKPISVTGQKMDSDNLLIEFKFKKDTIATSEIGWTYPERKRELIVVGENGSIILDGNTAIKRLYFRSLKDKEEEITFPNLRSALEQEVLEFVDSIKNKRIPMTSIEQGVEVTKAIDLIQKDLL